MLALASVGGTVVAAGRTMSKLEAARKAVTERNGGELKGVIDCFELDLNDYDSITTFVESIKAKYPTIDVLINK